MSDESVSSGGFEAALDRAAGVESPATQPDQTSVASPAASVPAESVTGSTGQGFGPVPYERFSVVNRERSTFKDHLERLRWAEQYQPDQVQQYAALAQRMSADPVAFAEQLIGELQAHPEYAPRAKSIAAKLMASLRGTATPAEEPEPGWVDQGTGEQFYSAKELKALRAADAKRVEALLDARLKPIETERQQAQQREAYARFDAALKTDAKAQHDFVKDLPGFTEHKPVIAQALRDHPDWSLYQGYLHTLKTVIYPTLTQREQAKTMATLQQKAGAATTNPAQSSTTLSKSPTSMKEALERAYAAAGGT